MSMSLGTATGVIELDYRGKGAAEAASADLDKVRSTGDKAGPALDKVSKGAMVAGAGIVAGLGIAVKAAADFEKGLSGIQAVSGATGAQMDQVRSKALQLGADTQYSAGEAAGAMEELVKAGIPIPDVLNGAADAAVALAAAGGIDLPQAAAIASNAMNQFGLSAAELPGIADKIAGAANASAIDVSDFGMSMSQAGAVAHLAGLGFDDMALAITAMGNAGIKGSDAGTSLKTFLQNLQPSTKKQTELFKELGIVTKDGANQFFDAKGKIKSMADIAGVLQKSLKGMSDQQKTAALETMFGSDAIRAAAVIAGQGSEGMNKLSDSINKVKAADVAATRMNNLSGQVEQLKGSAETLAIGIGSILIPALTNITKALTGVVNWFSSLDSGTQKAIAITAMFVGSLLLLFGAFIKGIQTVLAVRAALTALNGTILAMPIFWIIAAIIAFIAILVVLYKNNETFRNFVNKAWAAIKTAIAAVVNWITGTAVPWLINAWNTIKTGAQDLWNAMVAVWNAIVNAISTAINAVVSVVTTVGNAIKTAWTATWNAISAVVSTVWNFIVAVITAYITAVVTIVTTILNVILGVWRGVWGLFGPLVKAIWDLITAIIQVAIAWILVGITTWLNAILGVWRTVWNAVVAVFSAIWGAIVNIFNAIKGVATSVWNAVYGVIASVVNRINAVIMAVFNAVRGYVMSVFNAIRAVATSVWNAIYAVISSVVNRIRSAVTTYVNGIRTIVSSVWNAIRSVTSSIWNGLVGIISGALGRAKSTVSGAINTIKGFFSGAGSWLYDAGKRIIQGLIDGIRAMVGNVAGAISGIADKIRGFLPGSPIKEGPLRQHGWNSGEPGKKLVDMVAGGIRSNLTPITEAFSSLVIPMPTALASPEVAVTASARRTGSAEPVPVAAPLDLEAVLAAARNGDLGNKEINVEFNVQNPVAEKSSESAVREMTRVGALGVFD